MAKIIFMLYHNYSNKNEFRLWGTGQKQQIKYLISGGIYNG